MKRLIFPIWLLMVGQVFAYGTSKEDTTSAITFVHSVGMDSVRYYASQDTTSWEINRLMVRGFSPDSTNYVLIDTFDNPGTYFVKIEYWEGGAANAKYLPDIRDVAPAHYGIDWANITNPSGSTPDVNVTRISGDVAAATNAESFFDETGYAGTGNTIPTVTNVTNPEYVYKMVVSGSPTTITFDVSYIDPSPSTEANDFCLGMLVRSQDGNSNRYAVNIAAFTIADSNFIVRPGFQSAPNVGDTMFILPVRGGVEPSVWTQFELDITAEGNAGVDFSNINGTLDASEIGGDAITDAKIATNAIGNDELADDLTFDSLKVRTFVILNASGDALYIESGANTPYTAVNIVGSGTSTDGIKFTVTGIEINAPGLIDLIWDEDTTGHKTDPQMGYWITQGGTASLPDSVVARIDSLLISMGYNTTSLQTKVDALGAGTGVNACSLWLYDTGNTVMVSGIMVQAENSSGANQGRNRTNVSGISVLNLNDGSYNLRIPMNSGYIQTTNPQPFTVSGATNDTINVTAFSPTAPAGDLTTVYNWVVDGNDQPVMNASAEAWILQEFWPVTNSNKAIVARHSVKTDSAGLWELPIFGNDIVLTSQGDSSSFWMIKITSGGQPTSIFKMTVSSDSTQQLGVKDSD